MQWFDGGDDDAADPVNFDNRSQITVGQLLLREGFRPTGSRRRHRTFTGVAWVAVGAVISAVLWHHPIGTFLTSGSAADATPDIAQRPAGTDPTALAASRAGVTAAVPHGTKQATVPVAPNRPVLVVIPPSASTVSTRRRSHRDGLSRRLPVVTTAVPAAVAPVVTAVAPVTPVTWTQPSFGWFDGGSANWSGGFGGQWGGGQWGGCGGWGR